MVALQRPLEVGGVTVHGELSRTIRLRPLRRDALPEYTHYVDSGCDIHDSCLTCPLERCRYDAVGGARAIRGAARDREIIARWRDGGSTVGALAAEFGVSRRTVFRVLSRARQQDAAEGNECQA